MPEPKIPEVFRHAVRYGNYREIWYTHLPQLDGFSPCEFWRTGIALERAAKRQEVIRVIQTLYQ